MKSIKFLCIKNRKLVNTHQKCPKFDPIPEILIHKKIHIRCYNCRFLTNN